MADALRSGQVLRNARLYVNGSVRRDVPSEAALWWAAAQRLGRGAAATDSEGQGGPDTR